MSLRRAVNAKCKDCIYDPLAGGTWRAQVAACTCVRCPLFAFRPRPSPDRSTPPESGGGAKSGPFAARVHTPGAPEAANDRA
jgi:hypothetical protein